MLDTLHRRLEHDAAAQALEVGAKRLPHHARAESRILELLDERLDLLGAGLPEPLEEHAA